MVDSSGRKQEGIGSVVHASEWPAKTGGESVLTNQRQARTNNEPLEPGQDSYLSLHRKRYYSYTQFCT